MVATRRHRDFRRGRREEARLEGLHRASCSDRATTLAETTAHPGRASGKPDLAYVQLGYDDFAKALVDMGLSKASPISTRR
jgi:hypothetical protein